MNMSQCNPDKTASPWRSQVFQSCFTICQETHRQKQKGHMLFFEGINNYSKIVLNDGKLTSSRIHQRQWLSFEVNSSSFYLKAHTYIPVGKLPRTLFSQLSWELICLQRSSTVSCVATSLPEQQGYFQISANLFYCSPSSFSTSRIMHTSAVPLQPL